jgi:hypothetical protein
VRRSGGARWGLGIFQMADVPRNPRRSWAGPNLAAATDDPKGKAGAGLPVGRTKNLAPEARSVKPFLGRREKPEEGFPGVPSWLYSGRW